ncbi:hypothetical protein ACQR16_17480 [Bradyrhizobium oligotrophicum]|uniref:hypothetical protein n=1 Tax=Bradyrhizobium oligotrophicum TaxID=44255 RepID=UPI003EBF8D7D
MRQTSARLALVLMAALSLAACASRNAGPAVAVGNDDDDAVCQAGGKVPAGSPEYVACRKDRDVQRQRAEARADRRQRDLGEYMLNHPNRP